jgi:hypothetical protein
VRGDVTWWLYTYITSPFNHKMSDTIDIVIKSPYPEIGEIRKRLRAATATIGDVRAAVAEHTGAPPGAVRIICGGRIFPDDTTTLAAALAGRDLTGTHSFHFILASSARQQQPQPHQARQPLQQLGQEQARPPPPAAQQQQQQQPRRGRR